MQIFRIFRRIARKGIRAAPSAPGVPTVKFDSSRVTKDVCDDIRATVAKLPDIPTQLRPWLLDIAILSVKRGRDLGALNKALLEADIPGMDNSRAASISRLVHNRATALITKNSWMKMGVTEAKWMNSGVPCFRTMAGMEMRAAAHAAAGGKIFPIAQGLVIAGFPS